MKKILFVFYFLFFILALHAQSRETNNLVIVTMDGLRWQEIFGGIDSAIVSDSHFTRDKEHVVSEFGGNTTYERRGRLFPFLWSVVNKDGLLIGDRYIGCEEQVANPYKFSYPGYNEIFTGYPDSAVNSNDKIINKNDNVLSFINQRKEFAGKVAVFSTWDCFPYILNRWGSHIYVNSDLDSLKFQNPALKLINDMQFLSAEPIDVRLDAYTYFAGREYLKAYHPRVLYIAFDETDDYAHAGMYDQYLKSAHAEDAMLSDLWKTIESIPGYKGHTTLLITCDHGRGDKIKSQWRDHGHDIEGAEQTWIAVIGPDLKRKGELKDVPVIYHKQIAATIGALLGLNYTSAIHPVAPPIDYILK